MTGARLALVGLMASVLTSTIPAPHTPQAVIDRLVAVWNGLASYTCTWRVHEFKNGDTQDRVYHIFFQKPLNTRAEVVAGDGQGSVAIWTGGDQVKGHQGGLLSFIRLNVDLHSHLATTLRGATIAQVNIGWLIQHLKSTGPAAMTVTQRGNDSVLTALVHESPPDNDVIKEVDVFSANGLPVEGSAFGADGTLLKHVVFSDYRPNVVLPPSTWQL